jgi:DNA-binding NarL/FixJ family response regulator
LITGAARARCRPPVASAPHGLATDAAVPLSARARSVALYRTRGLARPLSLRARTRERHRSNLMRQLAVRSASRLTVNAIPPGDVGF